MKLTELQRREYYKDAVEMIARIVVDANTHAMEMDREEGENVDPTTYGTHPETVKMYTDNMIDDISKRVTELQKNMK